MDPLAASSITPTRDRDATRLHTERKLFKGLDSTVYRMAGWWKRRNRTLEQLIADAGTIEALADTYAHLSDRRLRDHMKEIEEVFRRGRG